MNHRHRFSAHAREHGPHARSWIAKADSFIDAAARFAETHDVAEGDLSIVVTDCETGAERCFTIHVATGEIAAC